MTGLWQVSGKNRLTFKEMARLDIFYANHFSLWFDLKIILRTPLAIVRQLMDELGKGARAKRSAGNA
jgi:lipopolysaccharide/colanic/teichoic acid biosynthesis glycosyltransferase